jgi:type I restriction enzyme S subunit
MSFVRSQLGATPPGWRTLSFEEAFEDATGGNAKVQTSEYLTAGCLPVIDQGQSEIAGYVDGPELACKAKLPCVIFGDHTRALKWVNTPFVLGADGVKVLVPRDGVDPRFAFHYLQTVRLPEDLGYSRHFKYLKEIVVPAPPLPEQRRIAAILDKADAIRRKRQEAITLTDELLRSAFLEMFGDPGSNPRGWRTPTIDDFCVTGSGGTPSRTNLDRYYGGSIPWVKSGELRETVILSTEETITEEAIRESSVKWIPSGALLVAMYGATVGRIAQLGIRATSNQAVCHIVPDPTVAHTDFMFVGLQAQVPVWLGQAVGGAQPNISQGIIRATTIPLPPLREQMKFVEYAKKARLLLKHLKTAANEDAALSDSLTHRAFSGEL